MQKIIFILVMIGFYFLFFKVKNEVVEPTYFDVIKDKNNIPIVKILIQQVSQVPLEIRDDFFIFNEEQRVLRDVKGGIKSATIGLDKNGKFLIKTAQIHDAMQAKQLILRTVSGKPIHIGQKSYFGDILIHRNSSQSCDFINQLDLETYLLGVLAGETKADFHIEAIKVQAIVSRSYALAEMKANHQRLYHLKDTTQSQVYSGGGSIHEKFKTAVLETRGLVLTDQEKVFRAYFSASCGGATANLNSLYWEKNDHSVMNARICPFCKEVKPPKFYWQAKYEQAYILEKMNLYLKKIKKGQLSDLLELTVFEKDSFGRALSLLFKGSRSEYVIDAYLFRTQIVDDANLLRSTIFTIINDSKQITFKGVGWGHGVGLCQYGSQGMALKNRSVRDILLYYYTGAEISKLYE